MSRWQMAYETTVEYRAHIVKDLLEKEGIPAMVLNKQERAYLLGNHEVMVPADKLLTAKHFINEEISFE